MVFGRRAGTCGKAGARAHGAARGQEGVVVVAGNDEVDGGARDDRRAGPGRRRAKRPPAGSGGATKEVALRRAIASARRGPSCSRSGPFVVVVVLQAAH